MPAAIAAAFDSHPLAGHGSELAQHHCGGRLLSRASTLPSPTDPSKGSQWPKLEAMYVQETVHDS
jgi:hypothetical protein